MEPACRVGAPLDYSQVTCLSTLRSGLMVKRLDDISARSRSITSVGEFGGWQGHGRPSSTPRWRRAGTIGSPKPGRTFLPYLDRDGTAQSVLQSRMGLTKQAVQQFVDELVADGILQRRTNPDDRRGKILSFTRKGQRVLADANIVKVEIQSRYCAQLGEARFAAFMAALEVLEGDVAGRRGIRRPLAARRAECRRPQLASAISWSGLPAA